MPSVAYQSPCSIFYWLLLCPWLQINVIYPQWNVYSLMQLSHHTLLCSRTLESTMVLVTPVVHFSKYLRCSGGDMCSMWAGTRTSYCRTSSASMQTLSVNAKRAPIQPRPPAENERTKHTKDDRSQLYHSGKRYMLLTCIARPTVRFGVKKALWLKLIRVFTPVKSCAQYLRSRTQGNWGMWSHDSYWYHTDPWRSQILAVSRL